MFDSVLDDSAAPQNDSDGEPVPKWQPASITLAVAIALVYIMQHVFGGFGEFIPHMGSTHPGTLTDHAYWTLASSTLLHANILHVAFNVMFIAIVGGRVERVFGAQRMLCVFFVGGLAGSLGSSLYNSSGFGLGASGGGWALMLGEALSLALPSIRQGRPAAASPRDVVTILIINGAFSFVPGIDMVAHFVGGVVGAAVLLLTWVAKTPWAFGSIALTLTHAAALVCAVTVGKPWNGWPALDQAVPRTFGDGLITVDVPENLRVRADDMQAGDLWWDGIVMFYPVLETSEVEPYLAEFAAAWGISEWQPLNCGPACSAWTSTSATGEVSVSSQRAGELALLTLTITTSTTPTEHVEWAYDSLNSVRFTLPEFAVDQDWEVYRDLRPEGMRRIERTLAEHGDSPNVLNALAWHLATEPDDQMRDGEQAVQLAIRAVQMDGDQANYLDTLAAAYAETGDFESAVQTQRRAISADPSIELLTVHLRLFEQGKTVRDQ